MLRKQSLHGAMAFLLAAVLAGLGFWYFWQGMGAVPEAAGAEWRLTSAEISESAPIIVDLPEGTTADDALGRIRIDPEVGGQWAARTDSLLFRPEMKLTVGNFYTVYLTTDNGVLQADFQIREDPRVVEIFPKKDSEVEVDSEISIVFNRAMVALGTVDDMIEKEIVTMTPATPGEWRWISTRILQFHPGNKLVGSQDYEIRISAEAKSVDGVPIGNDVVHAFRTKRLELVSEMDKQVAFNEPMIMNFNQEVSLDKTRPGIDLFKKVGDGESVVPVTVEYGIKEEWSKLMKTYIKTEDRSQLWIWPQADQYGRSKRWDLETNYRLEITEVWPKDGNIPRAGIITGNLNVPGIVKEVTAKSARSELVTPAVFDPQGEIYIDFHDEIDLDKSMIWGEKIKEIKYGEKCQDQNGYLPNCERVADRARIVVSFQDNFRPGEETEIRLEKIVATDASIFNTIPVLEKIAAYPQLDIVATSPGYREGGSKTREMILCTTTPVAVPNFRPGSPTKKEFMEMLGVSPDEWKFQNAFSGKVDTGKNGIWSGEFCQGKSNYFTYIDWRLAPYRNYTMRMNLRDVFEQNMNYQTWFETGGEEEREAEIRGLQERIVTTTAGKTKLTFAIENMNLAKLNICQVSVAQMLKYQLDRIDVVTPPRELRCLNQSEDEFILPDKWWTKEFLDVDIADYFADKGHYIVTLSGPNFTTPWRYGNKLPEYLHTLVTVTDLQVVAKNIGHGIESLPVAEGETADNLVWVTRFGDGQGVAGADVQGYTYDYDQDVIVRQSTSQTDENGIARPSSDNSTDGFLISSGSDSAILPTGFEYNVNWAGSVWADKSVYISTDREIYRPGETVHLNGIYRRGYDGYYEVINNAKLSLEIFNYGDDSVWQETVTTDDWGVFDADFAIPEGASLDNYWVTVDQVEPYPDTVTGNIFHFKVAEYAPAPFEIDVSLDKQEYSDGETVKIKIEADYFTGLPVATAKVAIGLESRDWFFDRYQGGRDYFWGGTEYCIPWINEHWIPVRREANLNPEGWVEMEIPLNIKEWLSGSENQVSQELTIGVTVADQNGRSVSQEVKVLAHLTENYIGVRTDRWVPRTGEEFAIEIKSVSKEGKEISLSEIGANINQIRWEEKNGIWEKMETNVVNRTIQTDRNGNAVWPVKVDEGGSYEINITHENGFELKRWLYVAGEEAVWWGKKNQNQLDIEPRMEKNILSVGETGRVAIDPPFQGEARALITIERGKIFDFEVRNLSKIDTYEFIIQERYAPKARIGVTMLGKDEGGQPAIAYGNTEFEVSDPFRKLHVQIVPDKESYAPGEEVQLDLMITDSQGQPAQADIVVAVVDKAVEVLRKSEWEKVWEFFYGELAYTVATLANTRSWLRYDETLLDDDIGGLGGGGSGGEDEGIRDDFQTTALWRTRVRSDNQGRASVSFGLPDNLTTWMIKVLATDKETNLGTESKEIVSRKDIMIQPNVPRFLNTGDKIKLGADIFNQSDKRQELTVKLVMPGVFAGEMLQTETLEAGEKKEVVFPVNIPENAQGDTELTISAFNNEVGDTIQQVLPIQKSGTWEATATSGMTEQSVFSEAIYLPVSIDQNKTGARLSIGANSSLVPGIRSIYRDIAEWEYESTGVLVAQLQAAAWKKLYFELFESEANISWIQKQLEEIYKRQADDGGFTYYGGNGDFFLTMKVLEMLMDMAAAGVEIPTWRMTVAAGYLENAIIDQDSLRHDPTALLSTADLFFRRNGYLHGSSAIAQMVGKFADEIDSLPNSALLRLARLSHFAKYNFEEESWAELENRLNIDARGVFLAGDEKQDGVQNTAEFLRILKVTERDSELEDEILRWIWRSYQSQRFHGIDQSVEVLDTLIAYDAYTNAGNESFSLEIQLNNDTVAEKVFSGQELMDEINHEILFSDLKLGQIQNLVFRKWPAENRARIFYDIAARYWLPGAELQARDEGMYIEREYYQLSDEGRVEPVSKAKRGDVLIARIKIVNPKERYLVEVFDPLPAGMEILNTELETESDLLLKKQDNDPAFIWPWDYYFWDHMENRDDELYLWKEIMQPGEYEYEYYVRALIPGEFQQAGALVSESQFPENFGRSAGQVFVIE